jgi:hypothetical protein
MLEVMERICFLLNFVDEFFQEEAKACRNASLLWKLETSNSKLLKIMVK